MQTLEERIQLLSGHLCVIVLGLWTSGTDGFRRLERRAPQVCIQLVRPAQVRWTAMNEEMVRFISVGKAITFYGQQPGSRKRVE